MLSNEPVKIPLRARDGSTRAYALVDPFVAAWVNQWRWCINPGRGYAARGTYIKGKRGTVYLHAELLGLRGWAGLEGDHINRDKLDCRLDNLRVVTSGQNKQNLPSYKGAASKHRGVFWRKDLKKWGASMAHRHIGFFATEIEAAEAALLVRLEHMPYSEEVYIATR